MRVLALSCLLASLCSCNSDNAPTAPTADAPTSTGNDPGDGEAPTTGGTSAAGFPQQVTVFGVRILASAGTDNRKVLHAAAVMAEYLDNNEDGIADNPAVIDALVGNNAYLVMFRDEAEESSFSGEFPSGMGQNLFGEETIPNGAARGRFDASLEEVLHLITHVGYANAYPAVFGETGDSELTRAMDVARGGHFDSVPSSYPADAWYTYDDPTCDYACMATEYIYWALTSMLGAQEFPGRFEDIKHEWRLNTHGKVQATDPTVFALLTTPQYAFATVLPDGQYNGFAISLE